MNRKIITTICIIGILIGVIKIYYAIGNNIYNKKMEKIKEYENRNLYVNSPIEQKTLEKEGYSKYYFVSGNKEGETVVFLHPSVGDHRCFDRQIDYFSQKFRVITVDMLGHGLSRIGKSKDKISSTPVHVAEILAREGIEKAHVAGVSLGSLLAQDFALKYPGKTLSLTALGGYNINREQKEVAKAQKGEIFKWLFKMIFSMYAFRRYAASTTAIAPVAQTYTCKRHYCRSYLGGGRKTERR
jgi:pimeloyl-ACP methyl ester carboxylesterase